MLRSVARELAHLSKGISKTFLVLYLPVMSLLGFLHFPRDTDPSPEPGTSAPKAPSAGFYEVAYQPSLAKKRGLDYELVARAAAEDVGIEDQVRRFVRAYNLEEKRILEVGSGRGYLQDVVADYTGLDLSASVARYYHKPFVAGSATRMPFPDSSYDAIWTVWVMEHIPEPERALREMRRVLKPDGLLFLYVAWHVPPWAADGFNARPYSEFNWRGKLVKASVMVRRWPWFHMLYLTPIRAVRWAQYAAAGADERLRFRALDPNYDIYWEPDSDAAVSLDSFETHLWFGARGDRCLNCGGVFEEAAALSRNPLILRIRK